MVFIEIVVGKKFIINVSFNIDDGLVDVDNCWMMEFWCLLNLVDEWIVGVSWKIVFRFVLIGKFYFESVN